MKTYILLFLLSFFAKNMMAQNVGIGTITPNSNAILELKATNKGLLLPRLTDTNAIVGTIPLGLVMYSSSDNKMYLFQGSKWQQVASGSGNYWDLLGNTGTINGTHFIGTTDDVPLNFSVNNQKSGRISNSTGSVTAFGYQSLFYNAGSYNSAFGHQALYLNSLGYQNTATGYQALYLNSGGFNNTANGYNSMLQNVSGAINTAFGSYSLFANNAGNYNTATGYEALFSNNSGSGNTAIGNESSRLNTTGYSNIAVGTKALHNNSSGHNNVVIGDSAMYYQITPANLNNTAIGSKALLNAGGNYNTAVGSNTLAGSVNGNYNSALGSNANLNNISISNATAIGAFARVDISDAVVLGSVNGINGATTDAFVGIGANAPAARLHIKHNSYPTASLLIEETEDDFTRMEFRNINSNCFWQMNAKPEPLNGNSRLEFWNNSGGFVSTPFTIIGNGNAFLVGTLTQNSDARLKQNIVPVKNALDKIIQLNGYTYYWKNKHADNSMQTGVIAQEVQKLFPELVKENEQGILSVNYSGLIPVLIESIKDQQKQINELKSLVHQLISKDL